MASFDPKDFEGKDDFWFGTIGLPYEAKYRPIYEKYHALRFELSQTETVTLAAGASLAGFMENKNIYDFVAIYEEMMEDIEQKITEMFETFDIPKSHVSEAVKALDTHSQKKMFDNVKSQSSIVQEKEWVLADQILEELNLPFRISMDKDEFIRLIKA